MVEMIPRALLRLHPGWGGTHDYCMPLTLGGPKQGSGVPWSTTPSLKKVPAWLRKAEGGVLRLQTTQVVERSFPGVPLVALGSMLTV